MRCAQHVLYFILPNPPIRSHVREYKRSLVVGERIFPTCTLAICERMIPIPNNNFLVRLCFVIFLAFLDNIVVCCPGQRYKCY